MGLTFKHRDYCDGTNVHSLPNQSINQSIEKQLAFCVAGKLNSWMNGGNIRKRESDL